MSRHRQRKQVSRWWHRLFNTIFMLFIIFGVMFLVVRPIMKNIMLRGISP